MLGKHWHSNCRQPVAGLEGTPRPVLLTGAKKSHLGCLISFELLMGFQNFVVINTIHSFKKNELIIRYKLPTSSTMQCYSTHSDACLYDVGHIWARMCQSYPTPANTDVGHIWARMFPPYPTPACMMCADMWARMCPQFPFWAQVPWFPVSGIFSQVLPNTISIS